jgi:hypothetical protein
MSRQVGFLTITTSGNNLVTLGLGKNFWLFVSIETRRQHHSNRPAKRITGIFKNEKIA